ncbi:similar to An07g01340 [Aspergillus luchuensis]|uniref:Similar to An07g01340 n=1 Tax=Aspergillus kawachii TaxID=1069201 RepID=A0A146FT69_ASPKA|nr:similar to An07g01340 [Aspergillus luchuensis]
MARLRHSQLVLWGTVRHTDRPRLQPVATAGGERSPTRFACLGFWFWIRSDAWLHFPPIIGPIGAFRKLNANPLSESVLFSAFRWNAVG